MSTSPVATTVSDAGPAEAVVAADARAGPGPQPVSTATPSAASASRTRPMRRPLPTAGSVEGATASTGTPRAESSFRSVNNTGGSAWLSGETATASGVGSIPDGPSPE